MPEDQPCFLLSVIIPTYNEGRTLLAVIDAVRKVPIPKQIVIVDDGSADETPEILRQVTGPDILVHRHKTNCGKGMAIRTGLASASGDIVVIQDADLEYDPQDYLKLVEPIVAGRADVVYGNRWIPGVSISYRRFLWGGRFLSLLTNLLYGANINDEPTCYKTFRAEVLRRIQLECMGFEFCPEVTAKVLRLGYWIHEVPISYRPRSFEEGKKISWRDGLKAVYTLLKFRFLPMDCIEVRPPS